MNTSRGFRFSYHVSAVMAAIAFIYISTIFVFIDQWFGLGSSPGMLNAIFFTFFAFMCAFSYSIAVFTDPGRVPTSFGLEIEDGSKYKDGDLKYCQKCSLFKPPRAHHCGRCNRCVLRMDHHCVWMSNCVGHANYKAFFVFVMYAAISCIDSLVLLVGSLAIESQDDQESEGSYRIIYVTLQKLFRRVMIFPRTSSLNSSILGYLRASAWPIKSLAELFYGVEFLPYSTEQDYNRVPRI